MLQDNSGESAPANQTPRPLHGMFNAIPPRYDLINRIITLGMDKRWRRLASQACLENRPQKVLDLGCGTGDLAINIARLVERNTEIVALDYSQPMLEKAQNKATKAGVGKLIRFIQGDAASLPFPDAYFDCVGISFAFRNLTYKNPLALAHLAEVKRVLKPGGRYIIVESSQPENRLIRALFHFYLRVFVAPIGIIFSGNTGAYRYLSESTRRFYSPSEVGQMLLTAGFKDVHYRAMFSGAAGIHVAIR